ncbi:uncharacterized protein LOC133197854 [Saccostrea echinata]|uniref:uncharacterized protein LOC133197854 n=1 Tax=Saccostrea echinata TaxID=191078 RepID=UPI002A81F0EF|nr:uncharacterized protein LOC133197854 [Saccostrea echinata]
METETKKTAISECAFYAGVLSRVDCPSNETEWKTRSKTRTCQGSDVYHCLVMEDGKTREEKCIEKTLILNGHCPIFTYDYYLHWKACNKTGCPSVPYRSDEVYKFPVCFDIEREEMGFTGSQKPRSKDNTLVLKIGISLGIIAALLVISIVIIVVIKRRRKNLPSLLGLLKKEDSGVDDTELGKLLRKQKPEYISISVRQLKRKNTIFIIGQLGNSVSTAGKAITTKYAKRHGMDHKCYNYLEVSDKFFKLCAEEVFEPNTVNFIDGWGGLWNDNPCERFGTLDTLDKVVKHSETSEDKRFVIGLRTEIRERLQEKLDRIGIRIGENERQSLDSSTNYKIKVIKKKIGLLQRLCLDKNCVCKSLDDEKVSGINQVRIGAYLVVKLMSLDHTMIPDFLDKEKGPLEAVRNHFEGLMEGERTWRWLPYFVCLGFYDKEEFKPEIAHEFDVTENMLSDGEHIAKYTKTIQNDKLAPMWSERFNLSKSKDEEPRKVLVFWHNFLYICAFHACYKKYPEKMMGFCNLDAILQLVRPKSHPDSLAIIASDEDIDYFCEVRLKNLADDDVFLEHPLVQDWRKRKDE